jgi:hypothetical protein
MGQDDNRLYAYVINASLDMPLTTAPHDRAWMDQWPDRAPYRCLPLVIANQAGWLIRNSTTFTAVWNGGHAQDSLKLDFGPPPPAQQPFANPLGFGVVDIFHTHPPTQPARQAPTSRFITSLFGGGVVTFNVPYLFRTPRGVNLWVKGPTNWIKDGAQALEGVVESDWIASSFTMNWKLTRPNYPVRFERGEPICMVVPVPRGLAEGLEPIQLPLESRPELLQEYMAWEKKRDAFNAALTQREPEAVKHGWQRDYQKGITAAGTQAPMHQTRVRLKEFTSLDKPPEPGERGV